jgi:hypothetical protein
MGSPRPDRPGTTHGRPVEAAGHEEFTPLGEPDATEHPRPGELSYMDGTSVLTRQAHPDDQALAGSGVTAEQVIGVLAHPVQPPDRYSAPGQRGQGQIPELAGERARTAVHVFEYRSKAAASAPTGSTRLNLCAELLARSHLPRLVQR